MTSEMTKKSLVMTSDFFVISLVINMTSDSLVTCHWVPSCVQHIGGGGVLCFSKKRKEKKRKREKLKTESFIRLNSRQKLKKMNVSYRPQLWWGRSHDHVKLSIPKEGGEPWPSFFFSVSKNTKNPSQVKTTQKNFFSSDCQTNNFEGAYLERKK